MLKDRKSIILDNEFTIMSEIQDNEKITQRELSKKLGVSLSTINVLVNKMIKEGLIKMTQVSQKQVFYILTPIGIMEKSKKNVSYLKANYRAIYEIKENIKGIFKELEDEYEIIYVLNNDEEMDEMIKMAIHEFETCIFKSKVVFIDKMEEIDIIKNNSQVLVHMNLTNEAIKEFEKNKGLIVINLAEKL